MGIKEEKHIETEDKNGLGVVRSTAVQFCIGHG